MTAPLPQLRWIEAAIQRAQSDVDDNVGPNLGRVEPDSFAALAYLTAYDRAAAAKAKRDTDHLVSVLNGSAQP